MPYGGLLLGHALVKSCCDLYAASGSAHGFDLLWVQQPTLKFLSDMHPATGVGGGHTVYGSHASTIFPPRTSGSSRR